MLSENHLSKSNKRYTNKKTNASIFSFSKYGGSHRRVAGLYSGQSRFGFDSSIDPRHTSVNCSSCGEKVPKSLAVRTHRCPLCGLVLDRDHNAAINILQRATAGTAESSAWGEPALSGRLNEPGSHVACGVVVHVSSHQADHRHLTEISSTSKISVALGPIMGPAPRSP